MTSLISCINAALICSGLSFVTQLLGMLVPSILHCVIHNDTGRGNYAGNYASRNLAMWYIITCEENSCQLGTYQHLLGASFTFGKNQSSRRYDFSGIEGKYPLTRQIEFQVEATLALLMMAATVGLVLKHRLDILHCRFRKKRRNSDFYRYALAILNALISGGLIWIPVCAFIQANFDVKYFIEKADMNNGPPSHELGVPYALICSCTGGIFAIVSSLFMFRVICKFVKCGNTSNAEMNLSQLDRVRVRTHNPLIVNARLNMYSSCRRALHIPEEEAVVFYSVMNNSRTSRADISGLPAMTEEPTMCINECREDIQIVEDLPPSYGECISSIKQPETF